MPPPNSPPIHVLLVEDDPNEAECMLEALQESGLTTRIAVVEDGEAALRYLQGPDEDRPDLILLDLHLPLKSGREVLDVMKDNDRLRCIPIVILTRSEDERDFQITYNLHANCCVRKPADLDEFALTAKKIEHFWSSRRDPRPGN